MKPTLAEYLGLDWVLSLNEVFDRRVPVTWEARGATSVGKLTVDGAEFEVRLEPFTYEINHRPFQVMNVAFAKLINRHPTEELQLNSKNASSVIGAIVHAVREKLQAINYDAVMFAAVDNVEQRMRVYHYAVSMLKGEFNRRRENIDLGGGQKATVLFMKSVSSEDIDAFEQHLKDLGK